MQRQDGQLRALRIVCKHHSAWGYSHLFHTVYEILITWPLGPNLSIRNKCHVNKDPVISILRCDRWKTWPDLNVNCGAATLCYIVCSCYIYSLSEVTFLTRHCLLYERHCGGCWRNVSLCTELSLAACYSSNWKKRPHRGVSATVGFMSSWRKSPQSRISSGVCPGESRFIIALICTRV